MEYIYNHPEDFEGIEFPDFSEYSGNIILYGAGINGMICAYSLMERGIDFICYADSNAAKTGQE
jgi:ribulose 1,5-bisphosphate synthetase/thiazole synthase